MSEYDAMRMQANWLLAGDLFGGRGQFVAVCDHLVGVAVVSPETARRILAERNRHNREPNQHGIGRLAKDMLAGHFLLNGSPIVFDATGSLRDGRHRMEACILAGVPITTFVVIGVNPAAFVTFDQHSKRTTAQVLGIRGEQHTKLLGSALTFLHGFFVTGRITRVPASALTTIFDDEALLALHPDLRESAAIVSSTVSGMASRKAGGQGVATVAHYLFSRVDTDLADQFMQAVGSNVVPAGAQYEPLRRLVSLLLDNAARGYLHTREHLTAQMVKGWNAFAAGTSVRGVAYREHEPYPRLYGWRYDEDGRPVAPDAGGVA